MYIYVSSTFRTMDHDELPTIILDLGVSVACTKMASTGYKTTFVLPRTSLVQTVGLSSCLSMAQGCNVEGIVKGSKEHLSKAINCLTAVNNVSSGFNRSPFPPSMPDHQQFVYIYSTVVN